MSVKVRYETAEILKSSLLKITIDRQALILAFWPISNIQLWQSWLFLYFG